MPRISSKNQVTIPVVALREAGFHAGDEVHVEALQDGEMLIRRGAMSFDEAFGVLSGAYPEGYLDHLDREDQQR